MKKILILITLIGFVSCNSFKVDPITAYIIDEGQHNSYSYNFNNKRKKNPIAPILIRGNRLEFNFMFTSQHIYNYNIKDGDDINKLYGITSTKIHQNSARFGWRYIGNNKFEIFAYYYVKGIRDWYSLLIVKINETVKYSIDVSNKQYTFGANNNWHHVYNTKNIMAFRSYPWFGGNNTAPHKMIFKIIEL